MPTKKEPSIRAKKYIKNKIAGMSDYQAAVAAGYSPNTAKLASTNIENHSVKALMADLMDQRGLTDNKLLDALQEGLEKATRIHGTDDNFVEVPDYAVRHKYLDTALKLKDKFPDINVKHKGDEENPIKEVVEVYIVEDKHNE